MKAHEVLRKSADLLEERGREYDQKGGERSIPKVIDIINILCETELTCECGRRKLLPYKLGWAFMHQLKKVRLWTNPAKFHRDSGVDSPAYDALEVEEWAKEDDERNKPDVELGDARNSREASRTPMPSFPDTGRIIEEGVLGEDERTTPTYDWGKPIVPADEAEG